MPDSEVVSKNSLIEEREKNGKLIKIEIWIKKIEWVVSFFVALREVKKSPPPI